MKSSFLRNYLQQGHKLLWLRTPLIHNLHNKCKHRETTASSIGSRHTGHIIYSFSLIYLIISFLYFSCSSGVYKTSSARPVYVDLFYLWWMNKSNDSSNYVIFLTSLLVVIKYGWSQIYLNLSNSSNIFIY